LRLKTISFNKVLNNLNPLNCAVGKSQTNQKGDEICNARLWDTSTAPIKIRIPKDKILNGIYHSGHPMEARRFMTHGSVAILPVRGKPHRSQ
jgi:hypothetical protein